MRAHGPFGRAAADLTLLLLAFNNSHRESKYLRWLFGLGYVARVKAVLDSRCLTLRLLSRKVCRHQTTRPATAATSTLCHALTYRT